MSFYLAGEYTTISELKTQYIGAAQTVDDVLLLDQIREASRMIDAAAQTEFYPLIQTRVYDIPIYGGHSMTPSVPRMHPSDEMKLGGLYEDQLYFDRNLCEMLTVTNGDGSVIVPANYWLVPANRYPKTALMLKPTSGITWLLDADGNWRQALSINAVWGYHEDYNTYAWSATGNALTSPITTTATTAAYLGAGTVYAGWLGRIDAEYVYISAVTSGTTNGTVTITRGVNGSTATSHTTAAAVEHWHVNSNISSICRRAAASLYDLRSSKNPIEGTLQLDSISVQTPGDVQSWIVKQLGMNAMTHVVFA